MEKNKKFSQKYYKLSKFIKKVFVVSTLLNRISLFNRTVGHDQYHMIDDHASNYHHTHHHSFLKNLKNKIIKIFWKNTSDKYIIKPFSRLNSYL